MKENNIAILNLEDISKIVENSVQQALKESLPSIIRRANLPEYINTEQLCKLASWSSSKCYYLRQKGDLKYIQHGRSILYPTEWVLAYLEKHKIQPRKEVLEELEESEL